MFFVVQHKELFKQGRFWWSSIVCIECCTPAHSWENGAGTQNWQEKEKDCMWGTDLAPQSAHTSSYSRSSLSVHILWLAMPLTPAPWDLMHLLWPLGHFTYVRPPIQWKIKSNILTKEECWTGNYVGSAKEGEFSSPAFRINRGLHNFSLVIRYRKHPTLILGGGKLSNSWAWIGGKANKFCELGRSVSPSLSPKWWRQSGTDWAINCPAPWELDLTWCWFSLSQACQDQGTNHTQSTEEGFDNNSRHLEKSVFFFFFFMSTLLGGMWWQGTCTDQNSLQHRNVVWKENLRPIWKRNDLMGPLNPPPSLVCHSHVKQEDIITHKGWRGSWQLPFPLPQTLILLLSHLDLP